MVAEHHDLAEGLYLQERETFLKKKEPVECNPVKEDWEFIQECFTEDPGEGYFLQTEIKQHARINSKRPAKIQHHKEL